MLKKVVFISVILVSCTTSVFSQNWLTNRLLRTGFVYSTGGQNSPIAIESDYLYSYSAYKFSNHFRIKNNKKSSWELLVEPSYYKSKHQLINVWYISHLNPNREALLSEFLPEKDINEYVLNLGGIYRYQFVGKLSIYGLVNVGPMYIDTETERLAKGFAFSDIFALGFNFKDQLISLDFKCYFRHVSNANLQDPNFGLNAFGTDFGVYYEF